MPFNWPFGRKARRQKLLATPLPALWQETLHEFVPLYAVLPDELRSQLIAKARIMVAERIWAGSSGLELTEGMKIVVAAQAVVLLAGDEGYLYERLPAIQLYPEFIPARPHRKKHPDSHTVILGDAWPQGNIRLSWPVVVESATDPHDGENVVFHEMAHHLDGLDGQMGGQPPLATESLQQRWPLVTHAYRELVQDLIHERWTWLDSYAGESPEEFFAVVTEAFFEAPNELDEHYPELYSVFVELYRVDPRGWFAA